MMIIQQAEYFPLPYQAFVVSRQGLEFSLDDQQHRHANQH